MTRKTQNSTRTARRTKRARCASPVLLTLMFAAASSGAMLVQNAVGNGRALQANMRVAQPPRARSGMSRQAYTPGYSVQAKPLYVVSHTGEMVYAPNNAFAPRSSYTTQDYNRGNPYSASSMKRFRGYGGGSGNIGYR